MFPLISTKIRALSIRSMQVKESLLGISKISSPAVTKAAGWGQDLLRVITTTS